MHSNKEKSKFLLISEMVNKKFKSCMLQFLRVSIEKFSWFFNVINM